MTDYKVAALLLTDANKGRFSIPEEVVNKPKLNPAMRLEAIGLKVKMNPFSFSFSDVRDSSNVFINTSNTTLVFLDKYI